MARELTDLADVLFPNPEDRAAVQEQSAVLNRTADEAAVQIIAVTCNLEKPIPETLLVVLAGRMALPIARLSGGETGKEFFLRLLELWRAKHEQLRSVVMEEAPDRRHALLRRLLAEGAGELVSLLIFTRRKNGNPDLTALASHGAPETERIAAAKRLASTSFKKPIPGRRWNAHSIEIAEAIRERCNADAEQVRSRDSVLMEVTEAALMVAGLEAGQIHNEVYLEVEGQRRKVLCAPAGLIPKLALPERYFDAWFRARVADEALSMLVPDWREREREQRKRNRPAGEDDAWDDTGDAVEISLDELRAKAEVELFDPVAWGNPLDALIEAESATEDASKLAEVLELASPQQLQITDRMNERLEQGHSIQGVRAEAARDLDIPAHQVRKQLERLRKGKRRKLTKK